MSNWIPVSERLPTREDADERGAVAWKWADSIAMVGRWDKAWSDPQPVARHPLPPYTPPKPGPTDEELRMLFCIFARRNSWAFTDIRRWFDEVTARIEREKGK